jgi:hypothetical protein
MSKRYLFITLLLFVITSNIYSDNIFNIPAKSININVSIGTEEEPYSISIKYNDPDLVTTTSTYENTSRVLDEQYKLTETTETAPFYININNGKINNDIRFEVTIIAGEFTGLDFRNETVKTGVIPNISIYENYEYSYESNLLNNSLVINKYIPKGIITDQHMGAFTIKWTASDSISSGTYTSTNVITITSELASEPSTV